MKLVNSHDGTKETILGMDPDTEYQKLCAHIPASGTFWKQSKVIRQQTQIKVSSLARKENLIAFNQYLIPKVNFTSPCMTASRSEFEETQQGAICMMANIVGLNRHFLRVILHTGQNYFGMEILK